MAPPQQHRSKDDTAHPHQPGARPEPPHPDPAHSLRRHPAKAKVKFPSRNRIFNTLPCLRQGSRHTSSRTQGSNCPGRNVSCRTLSRQGLFSRLGFLRARLRKTRPKRDASCEPADVLQMMILLFRIIISCCPRWRNTHAPRTSSPDFHTISSGHAGNTIQVRVHARRGVDIVLQQLFDENGVEAVQECPGIHRNLNGEGTEG